MAERLYAALGFRDLGSPWKFHRTHHCNTSACRQALTLVMVNGTFVA